MQTLWQKNEEFPRNKLITQFTVGDDPIHDLILAPYDIHASLAHAHMLTEIHILLPTEYQKIKAALKTIHEDHLNNTLTIEQEHEDIHTKIEYLLTKSLGETGKKIHTGRSRNDQILTTLRLYSKDKLFSISKKILNATESLLKFAKKHEFTPFPGYTHMQLAMPSSLGMWGGAFVENLLDELQLIHTIQILNDQCPLGSAAGYGTILPLDRELTQKLLGFRRLQRNALYCSNSRGKIEAHIITALSSIGLILNKIASDLLLFTTKEFDFFEISSSLTTGSSIMPQKQNLDILELIRAKTTRLLGLESTAKHIISHLISGYHRDFQESKALLIESFKITESCLQVLTLTIDTLQPTETKILQAHKPEIYATNKAYEMVMQGKAFRTAYQDTAQELTQLSTPDPHKELQKTSSPGSTANLQLKASQEILDKFQNRTKKETDDFHKTLDRLWQRTPRSTTHKKRAKE